jgi:hypothetical protein
MKKLFLGSVALFVFSISILVFQISCKKDVIAQSSNSSQQLNITLLSKSVQINVAVGDSVQKRSAIEYYTINSDGNSLQKIPISMPGGLYPVGDGYLTPDGKTIFFQATSANYQSSIYSCGIDGNNLKKLVDGTWKLLGTY